MCIKQTTTQPTMICAFYVAASNKKMWCHFHRDAPWPFFFSFCILREASQSSVWPHWQRERERELWSKGRARECVICVDVASFSFSLSALQSSILLQLSFVLSKPERGLQLTVYFCTKGDWECACDGCQPNSPSLSLSLCVSHPHLSGSTRKFLPNVLLDYTDSDSLCLSRTSTDWF